MTQTEPAAAKPAVQVPMDANAVRQAIIERMADRGETQRSLARRCGVAQSALSEFLSGRRETVQLDTIAAIARGLGTSVGALLGEAAPGGADADSVALMAIESIIPNPENPRKTFDDESLDSLALSIRARGLVQPLVIRRDGTLVDGERRFRAIKRAVARGDLPADTRVPVFLREDGDTLDSLVANAQREDIAPLEQARALLRLRDEFNHSTADMAAALGVTQRHIQLRLALVEQLHPRGQELLQAGIISLAVARVLCIVPQPRQATALGEIEAKAPGWRTADEIRHSLQRDLIPVGRNAFKLDAWPGELVTDPDNEALQFFPDRALFMELQREACAAVADRFRAQGYAWVQFVDKTRFDPFELYDYEQDDDFVTGRGAVVVLDHDGSVETHRGLRLLADAQPEMFDDAARAAAAAETGSHETAAAAPDDAPAVAAPDGADTPEDEGEPGAPEGEAARITKTHLALCNQAKTAALQNAMARAPDMAMRAACLALMSRTHEIKLSGSQEQFGMSAAANWPALDELEDELAGPFKHLRNKSRYRWPTNPLAISSAEDDLAKAWDILCGLDRRDVGKLLAVLIARLVGTWNHGNPTLGDSQLAIAMAESLAVQDVPGFQISRDFVDTCGRAQLHQMLSACPAGRDWLAQNRKPKVSAMQDAVMDAAVQKQLKDWRPPTVRWGTAATLEQALPRQGDGR